MKWFINLSTPVKLVIAFGMMWLMLGAVIVIAYRSITDITLSTRQMHDVDFKIDRELSEVRAYMNYNRVQMLEMIMTAGVSARKTREKDIQAVGDRVDGIIDTISGLRVQDSKFQKGLNELKKILAAHRQVRERQIDLINAGNVREAVRLGIGLQDERYDRIRAISLELGANANSEVNRQLVLQQRKSESSSRLFIIIGTFSLLAGIAMAMVLFFTMARPLGAITDIVTLIASGDLSATLPLDDRSDEMGMMTRAFRGMVENLRRIISDIGEGVALLGSTASEILASTTQVASGTAQTATAISETTSTVGEVRQASMLSSEKAKNVSETANRVAQVSRDGQKAVEETVLGVENIRDQMESITRTVVHLSEQSQSIGGIIASVTDLADQSNLLSVNAAIEASRAGEQGKGFSVVAQEIKALAEQSKQATSQVREILNEVQKATGTAVMAAEQGSKAVEACIKLSSQAGEAIRVLSESSQEAVQATTQIVASSQQQVIGMDQIGMAMENINQASAQTAASMRQSETAAKNLNDLGKNLKETIGQFRR